MTRLAGVVVVLIAAAGCFHGVSEAELARRVAASHPLWPSYQEDIKGQVGAGPVAEWQGTIEAVQAEHGVVRVTFRLAGPWGRRDLAMPILLREPLQGIHRPVSAHRRGDRMTYVFHIPVGDGAPPWVEVKYPRTRRRIILSDQGRWQAR